MTLEHSMVIQWSHEDQAYVVSFPEFPGAHTHGATYAEAATNGTETLELLIESYRGENQDVPKPQAYGCPVMITP